MHYSFRRLEQVLKDNFYLEASYLSPGGTPGGKVAQLLHFRTPAWALRTGYANLQQE